MRFILSDTNEYINVKQIVSMHSYLNNTEYSEVYTSDGRSHLVHLEIKKLANAIRND